MSNRCLATIVLFRPSSFDFFANNTPKLVEWCMLLTMCVAEIPEAGNGDLVQVLVISCSVVSGVGHLLLREQPVVGGDSHGDDG